MGDIVTAGAADLATALFSECTAVAVAPCPAFVERQPSHADPVDAARYRAPRAYLEADHILGDLLRPSGGGDGDRPLLRIACAHAKTD